MITPRQMRINRLLIRLRRNWYLILLGVAIVVAVTYFLWNSNLDAMELLGRYGYLVILVWTFLEGETIVIIAGALADTIGLKPWLIAVCAFCGSFLSDQVMFSLGKYKGTTVLRYFPKVEQKMDKAAAMFKKYDVALILGFRFVYGVRNIVPIMLGISGVSHRKFLLLNFIGASIWAITFAYGGYFAGQAFIQLMHQVGHGILYVVLGLILVGVGIWFVRSRRAAQRALELAAQAKKERGLDSESTDEPIRRDDVSDSAMAKSAKRDDAAETTVAGHIRPDDK